MAAEEVLVTPVIDLSELNDALAKLKKAIKENLSDEILNQLKRLQAEITQPITATAQNIVKFFDQAFKGAFDGVQQAVTGVANDVTQSFGQGIKTASDTLQQYVMNSAQNIAGFLGNAFPGAFDAIQQLVMGGAQDLTGTIGQWFQNVFGNFQGYVQGNAQNIVANVGQWFQTVFANIQGTVQGGAQNAVANIAQWFQTTFGNIEQFIGAGAGNIVQVLGQGLQNAVGVAQQLVANATNGVVQFFNLGESFKAAFGSVEKFSSVAVQGIVGFFSAVASGQKTWSDAKQALKDYLISVLSALEKQVIGSLLAAQGWALANSLWTFGGSWLAYLVVAAKVAAVMAGFQAIKGWIQGLATGGLVTSPTLALVGEAGPEAVIPLDRAVFSQIASGVADKMQGQPATSGMASEIHLHVGTLVADDLGLKKLERQLSQFRISENSRLGVNA